MESHVISNEIQLNIEYPMECLMKPCRISYPMECVMGILWNNLWHPMEFPMKYPVEYPVESYGISFGISHGMPYGTLWLSYEILWWDITWNML
jgi:hypothetical protein